MLTVGRGLTVILMVSPFALLTQVLPSLILSTQKRYTVGLATPMGAVNVLVKLSGLVPLLIAKLGKPVEALSRCNATFQLGTPVTFTVKVTVSPEQMVSLFTERLLLGDGLTLTTKSIESPRQVVGKGPVATKRYRTTACTVSVLINV